MRNSLGVDIAELLPGARSVVVDWVVERERSRSNRNETQHQQYLFKFVFK